MKIETLAVHAGHTVDPATGAVSRADSSFNHVRARAEGTYPRGFMYSRNNNPNRQALEHGISALEGGAAAAAFASGTAASSDLSGAGARRSRPRACGGVLRNIAITARNFSALGTRRQFRRHERSARALKRRCARRQNSPGWKLHPIRC